MQTFNPALDQLCRHTLLSHDETLALFDRLASGDMSARDALILHNQRLIVSRARRFLGRGFDLEDLVSEGNIGLLVAIDKFDHTRGTRFTTLAAWWIDQVIGRAVSNRGRTIRVPVHTLDRARRLQNIAISLRARGETPTIAALARESGESESAVMRILQGTRPAVSLDRKLQRTMFGDDESPLSDFVHCDDSDAHEAIEQRDLAAPVLALVAGLSAQVRDVLLSRWGFTADGEAQTLDAIAQRHGLTRERIRQIEAAAIVYLRRKLGVELPVHSGPFRAAQNMPRPALRQLVTDAPTLASHDENAARMAA